jgi:hypothetical protein
LVLSIAVTVAFAALFAYLGQYFAAVIWLLFAALYAWAYWSWRFRIPFAKVMLKTVTSITKQFPSTILVGVGALLVQFAYCCWWILTLIGLSLANSTVENGNPKLSHGASYGLYIYSLFTFYWTSQVIGNVVHITVAGLFATVYFKGVVGPDGQLTVPVQNPTSAALKRALTTSLGPNCYGSLLIAIIQTLKALADQARSQNGADNIACTIIMCCISCILALIQDVLEYFNKYA